MIFYERSAEFLFFTPYATDSCHWRLNQKFSSVGGEGGAGWGYGYFFREYTITGTLNINEHPR